MDARTDKRHFGAIPVEPNGRPYDIHHVDGDYRNNDPANLTAITIKEHYDIHFFRGDWRACHLIGIRMGVAPEILAELSSECQMEKVADGTHHFLKRTDGTSLGSEVNRKRVKDKTHHWTNSEVQRATANRRVANGTHPLLGGEMTRLANSIKVSCLSCQRETTYPAFKHYHGEKCRLFVNVIHDEPTQLE